MTANEISRTTCSTIIRSCLNTCLNTCCCAKTSTKESVYRARGSSHKKATGETSVVICSVTPNRSPDGTSAHASHRNRLVQERRPAGAAVCCCQSARRFRSIVKPQLATRTTNRPYDHDQYVPCAWSPSAGSITIE